MVVQSILLRRPKPVKVAFVSSEVYPFIKTGGLADVAYALPKALAKQGHDVCVILPGYKQIPEGLLKGAYWVTNVEVMGKMFWINCVELEGIKYYLMFEPLFSNRDSIYDCPDRDYQFAMFCEVTLRLLKNINFQPDIIHTNDWQTGLIPFFMNQRYYADPFYYNTKTVYTIHNLRFQGQFSSHAVRHLGYRFDDIQINYMQLGIQYANKVTTVSETYAKEILTDFYGENLNHILKMRQADLTGIVNGIDVDLFNPETDPALVSPYTVETLELKAKNKEELQQRFNLEVNPDIPLIGIITRLDSQKGLDLITHILEEHLIYDRVQFFLLGSGEAKYEQYFQWIRDKYPNQVGIYLGYNGELANLVYGASDMFLMPSLYEPCGLSQLISLRYGTVPIVRETGGLKDTVHSYNEETIEGNGFSFTNYNAHDMLHTLRRAVNYYRQDKDVWRQLMVAGMTGDYSWENSAQRYVELYQSMMDQPLESIKAS